MKKLVLLILLVQISIQAQVTLPNFFTDNMVLQRDAKIPVWGWAKPNEKFKLYFHNQKVNVTADANGNWKTHLKPEQAGGPYSLKIKGKNTLILQNILVGDVWLCSGQSNMEWTVGQSDNAENELKTANYPNIRHIKIPKEINTNPQQNTAKSEWKICTPENVGEFTGVGYFFAKNMYENTQIPIGLINASWGGTNIETWMSQEAFEDSDEYKEMIAGYKKMDFEHWKENKTKEIEQITKQPITAFDSSKFIQIDFDDSSLPFLHQPENWENQTLGNFDGVVWIRKTVELTEDDLNNPAFLELSKIDDEDVTYVNGTIVGENKVWDYFRKYEIPKEILKKGKNVIAIKITDTGGGGGLWGNQEDVKLTIGNKNIPLAGDWHYLVEEIYFNSNVNSFPSLAYNAMINPLIPFAIKGTLWYQGESNDSRAYQYRTAFPLMIKDWRGKWHQGNFPFYFVQLATYNEIGNSTEGCPWAELREAQTLTLSVENTGMCGTTDIGNPNDIHPRNKQEVGRRLANIALHDVFGKDILAIGATYKSMEISENQIIVTFENVGEGLKSSNGSDEISGFEIAGENQIFQEVKAKIISPDQIQISFDDTIHPVAVRYAWMADASKCNLYNSVNLPAVPFRTDDFNTITKDKKYKI